ncbi:hypothetical protein O6H91_17G088700 [Diphasiastrum complanatum]|uniref:Uncharacterized protein n=2 Tax=Diphasiastrum complanatum TaxID=34168 RepID=A0ACC2B8W8_DIPCM|nr:hypothetical protein O6H91_18G062200 [Diphasiastrum complanatum]KAJ7526218.1 hypothetical protein O6H91_17G088700 [Diphasiastrum complanatum]
MAMLLLHLHPSSSPSLTCLPSSQSLRIPTQKSNQFCSWRPGFCKQSIFRISCKGSLTTRKKATEISAKASAAEKQGTYAMEISEEAAAAEKEGKYDAIVIGAGIGGLVAATQLAIRGARVLVLEKYLIPGGSSGYYERDGFTFDVGSSVMFGFGEKGSLNLMTRSLEAVGKLVDLIPDPTTVHYHMPNSISIRVHRDYEHFICELTEKFPHEKEGIGKFYGECWKVHNALISLELKSLEEPLYLLEQFVRNPIACLTLAFYYPQNAGDIARKYIKDQNLLNFIDAECFLISTVRAYRTPMINASMVLCERHAGGINYPVGGVGSIAKQLVAGLLERGGGIKYKANVRKIILRDGKAVGVRLSNGTEIFSKKVISNATRWDTFENLLDQDAVPEDEKKFQKLYKKGLSFLSIHLGVNADVLPEGTDCHHLVLEDDWDRMEDPYGTIFLSIPTVLDSSLCPAGQHILHIFTASSMDDWQGLPREEYIAKKERIANVIIERLEKTLFPGLQKAITFREVGTPRTHKRYLSRTDGTYGPIPTGRPLGLLGMPFNKTDLEGLYCVGDSCFPGQGVIAVTFSGVMCAHRVATDLGLERQSVVLDKGYQKLLSWIRGLALNY